MIELLDGLSSGPVAQALTASSTLYVFVSAAHILAIGLLVGAIIPLDLRVLGLFRAFSLADLGPFLSRAAAVGAALAIGTGIVLFTVRAGEYAQNPAFLTKMGWLAFGIANAALLHASKAWRQTMTTGCATTVVKAQASVSLMTWLAAVLAGRWIGFV